MKKKIIILLVVASIILAIILKTTITGLASSEEDFRINVNEISTDAKFYEKNLGDETVRFFVVRDANGEIKTAFDACEVCYNSKLGYRQEGDYMVCNNCGSRFKISGLGTVNLGGGCWPSYLEHEVDGDELLIKYKDLEKGKRLFQ